MADLDVTVGGVDANSYASIEEADEWNDSVPRGEAWALLSDEEKIRALILAAIALDSMPQAWTGQAASATQAMGWPRVGMKNRNGFAIPSDEIPRALKNAQSEFARKISQDERFGDNDTVNQGIESLKAGSVAISFREKSLSGEIVPDNPTASLAGLLFVPDFVKTMLVPSWLMPTAAQIEATGASSFMFELL